jgi:hypothetical protein
LRRTQESVHTDQHHAALDVLLHAHALEFVDQYHRFRLVEVRTVQVVSKFGLELSETAMARLPSGEIRSRGDPDSTPATYIKPNPIGTRLNTADAVAEVRSQPTNRRAMS